MNTSHRILFNTIAMYLKTIVNIFVTLFTTRYVLEALGVNDFGIFGLVGSVIGLLGFLNLTMASTTQRFLSYHRKQGNMNSVFSVSVILHFFIGVILAILLEIGGFLFLDNLNIAIERKEIAHFVFHCVVAITFFSTIATPFQALMNAFEDMHYMAIFSMAEIFIKLGIALFLFVSPYDRLGTYAVAMMVLAILMLIIQSIFCKIHYPKVIFSYKSINKELTYKILAFSGWNFFVCICHVFRVQSLPIFLNLFFGTAINAVYNIANQVTLSVSTFSNSLSQATAPQVISGIAEKNFERSEMLAISSAKLQLFLISLFGIPLILNIDYVLTIWLKQVPEYLSIFCYLALLFEIFLNPTLPLLRLIEGKGFIRGFMIITGFCNLLVLPIAYILLKMNYPPYSIYIALLTMPITINISRIYFAHRHVQLNVPHYLKEMSKVAATVVFAFLCTGFFVYLWNFNIGAMHALPLLVLSTAISSVIMLTGFWFALSAKEKEFAKGVWKKVRGKFLK